MRGRGGRRQALFPQLQQLQQTCLRFWGRRAVPKPLLPKPAKRASRTELYPPDEMTKLAPA